MLRIGILGSTRGTDMLAIIAAKQLPARIEVVISNKSDSGILERAREHGLAALYFDKKNISRADYDKKISAALQAHNIDLVILIGYMRILSKEFVNEWTHKVINVHPSLLPAYAGGMDQDVHQAVIDAGETETGCTVHYVTEEVDGGPILIQKKCAVKKNDTAQTLKDRVQKLEGEALIEAITTLSLEMKTLENIN